MATLSSFALVFVVFSLPLAVVKGDCNIDSAGLKTYSTSDGQVITKVGVVATFRLGCSPGTQEPRLHAETTDGQYLAVSTSSQNREFKEVSFIEEARQSGSSESYYQPMKTISVSHHGVSGGPIVKMETVAALGLVAVFFFAHTIRSKIVQ